MTALTQLFTISTKSPNLRPLDPHRDLQQVADLVELCFADTLDPDGRVYLRHMRAAAHSAGYLRLARVMNRGSGLPLSGYVWEAEGRLVGNLTLIPFVSARYRYYLIANVAVHPDYRRQGIAHQLTSAAVDAARLAGASSVWLHVREENQAAGSLYRALGFSERTRRTTWHCSSGRSADLLQLPGPGEPPPPEAGYQLRRRQPADWEAQQVWLRRHFPRQLAWYIPLRELTLQPGWRGFLYRMFNDQDIRQWSVLRNNRLLGTVAWQSALGYADHLWLAAGEEGEQHAVAALLRYARRQLSHLRALSLEYPADRAAQAIQTAGFEKHQTLVWMELPL